VQTGQDQAIGQDHDAARHNPQGMASLKKDDHKALLDALYELVQALAKQVDELAERVRQLEGK
jgi:hypothetical protein